MWPLVFFLFGFACFPLFICLSIFVWFYLLPYEDESDTASIKQRAIARLAKQTPKQNPLFQLLNLFFSKIPETRSSEPFAGEISPVLGDAGNQEFAIKPSSPRSMDEINENQTASTFSSPKNSLLKDVEVLSGWIYILKSNKSESLLPKSKTLFSNQKLEPKQPKLKKGFTSLSEPNVSLSSDSLETAADIRRVLFKPSIRCFASLKGPILYIYKDDSKKEHLFSIPLSHYCAILIQAKGFSESRIYSKKLPIALYNVSSIIISSKNKMFTSPQSLLDDKNYTKSNAAYYIFSERSVEKEDWYLSITKAIFESNILFDTSAVSKTIDICWRRVMNMVKLPFMSKNDITAASSVLDAFLTLSVGRVLLGLLKTKFFHSSMIYKLERKFASLSMPSFISGIDIVSLDVGSTVPLFSESKLLDVSDDAKLKFQSNVEYTGKIVLILKIVIKLASVSFRINIKLSVMRVKGTMIFYIKSPPTNRIWYGFDGMPDIDITLEPTLMQKKIKTKKIISALKSRLLTSFRTSCVLPNMNDIVFYNPSVSGAGGIFSSDFFLQDESEINQAAENTNIPSYLDDSVINDELDDISVSDKSISSFDTNPLKMDVLQSEIIRQEMLNNSKKQQNGKNTLSFNSFKFRNIIDIAKLDKSDTNSDSLNKNGAYLNNSPLSNTQPSHIQILSQQTEKNKEFSNPQATNNDTFNSTKNLLELQVPEKSITSDAKTNFSDLPADSEDQNKSSVAGIHESNINSSENLIKTLNFLNQDSSVAVQNSTISSFHPKSKSDPQSPKTSSSSGSSGVNDLSISKEPVQGKTDKLSGNEGSSFESLDQVSDVSSNLHGRSLSSSKAIASNLKSSVLTSAMGLYKTAKNSKAGVSAKKWIQKSMPSQQTSLDEDKNFRSSSLVNSESLTNPKTHRQSFGFDPEKLNSNSESSFNNSLKSKQTDIQPHSLDFSLPKGHEPTITEPPKLPYREIKSPGKPKIDNFVISNQDTSLGSLSSSFDIDGSIVNRKKSLGSDPRPKLLNQNSSKNYKPLPSTPTMRQT
ncbi:hypothetical protein BB560_005517 [Smittium megazygosporum]|uniref:SMP-LTD domain-containing protein n=1 Tax=Smittium megazygosporum TaxID=133381 RepID=A0A2T9Z481_9FUNG|nr:hypothetical protein BB560_005517 [Smittium megazygosporum]